MRLGIILCSNEIYDELMDADSEAFAVFIDANILLLEARDSFNTRTKELKCISPHFDEIPKGEVIPRYLLHIKTVVDGDVRKTTFDRVEKMAGRG